MWRQFIQVTALALSNSARVHSYVLIQRMRASIMRLRRPTFLPSITDRSWTWAVPFVVVCVAAELALPTRVSRSALAERVGPLVGMRRFAGWPFSWWCAPHSSAVSRRQKQGALRCPVAVRAHQNTCSISYRILYIFA